METIKNTWRSIGEMLQANAADTGEHPALLGRDGIRLSHRQIFAAVSARIERLRGHGLGSGDRVAIVMPPGPDLALAFLAVASVAVSAPLNPSYVESAFEVYLKDLSARALVVPKDWETPARAVAVRMNLPIIELDPLTAHSGEAETIAAGAGLTRTDLSGEEDVALVLHTSGTTSHPKRVPLTHANLCASARNIGKSLALERGDVSLSLMPLFHIHGLACLLAALGAGGSCLCADGPAAETLPVWFKTSQPTWFSAVPTVLQSVADFTEAHPFPTPTLRFIRSSSAALPPRLMQRLEKIFCVPVIESYGMTEAAHQMASNLLPPLMRKPGSVGRPAGPQITILNEQGGQVDLGGVGEVGIMGPNVTLGYEANPDANARAFTHGWFRTGDQGYFDPDGYLHLTGRLKELINRGGEKIAPREIDEALLAHPSVRQAVAFAVAHPSLGEDLAAAVVLQPDASCPEADLRTFLLDRLPAFKVPSRVIILTEIPKGPTGKIQRIGLAERFGDLLRATYEAPITETEKDVAAIVSEVLGLETVGRQDNFFSLGGDSLRATQVVVRLRRKFDLELPVPLLFRLPTAALLGARIDELIAAREVDRMASRMAGLTPEEQAKMLDDLLAPSHEPG